jgi:mannosyltransferase
MQQRIVAAGLQQRIHFVGDLESADIRRWYQRSRICVAASRREGFGLTPLEAMATGCVPVTSEAGAWPWIIQPNFGAMFQTGSASSLASQLSQLLTDMQKLDHLASVAREVACQHYSIQREASQVNQIYSQLATNSL